MTDVGRGGQHRAQPGGGRRRPAPVAGKRRADVRPRYGRIAILTAALMVTGIAVLGGFGLIPSGPEGASAAAGSVEPLAKTLPGAAEERGSDRSADGKSVAPSTTSDRTTTPTTPTSTTALPAGSGTGRRIVFSEGSQRVWLVGEAGKVLRTYLVSGSLTDNLDTGTYDVYARSRWAVGIDDSGTMQYFVRFTHGDEGGSIGFHTIPAKNGVPLQTIAQLGTPQSHGCIRQRTPDAIALWDFAPIGTTVVVTA
ncbi:L,D-transpeptidase [Nocardioides humilatus]|uniref:L,D-transpeptidase n=1 Tax=Nocardioides humilatus TaxID=2607660 RepID=A0A5B1LEX5_9ACTN|nr:L,D-transpeptidase [Nocardioides humilatus]KAA1418768.1 L,D-transpeptidase [Nocardioides humilatus]